MVVMVIVFAIGKGTFNPKDLFPEERGVFIALLVMMIAGLLAWRWEAVGGLIVLAGFGLFWYFEGNWSDGYFVIFPLAGCLYLIAWLLEHKPAEAVVETGKGSKGRSKSVRKPK
jgi:hypothetical protein